MNDVDDIVFGIDIGTSNLSISYFWNGCLNMIRNADGGCIIPSKLFFNQFGGYAVGPWSFFKDATNFNTNAVYEIKRLLGRKSDDLVLQKLIKKVTYKVDVSSTNPEIVIELGDRETRKSSGTILSHILERLKRDIKHRLGIRSKVMAVLTVPAHFNLTQREVVWVAAERSDFRVIKLLSEPTAIAYRYLYFHKKFAKDDFFLVYNLGGGMFDVAVYQKLDKHVKTIAVAGDGSVGGHDFDNLLLDYVCDIVLRVHQFDVKTDKALYLELRAVCEDAKIGLSTLKEYIMLLNFIPNVAIYPVKITRKRFEKMISKLVKKTKSMIVTCLKSVNLKKHDIKKVLLSGGSTRIPKVRKMLAKFFGEDAISKFQYRDEKVAEGAALQAAALSTHPNQSISLLLISDITPFSIGVRAYPTIMNTVIRRYSTLPCTAITTYCLKGRATPRNFCLDLYEGERIDTRYNRYLISVDVQNITRTYRGECKVDLVLNLDQDGRLKIRVTQTLRGEIKQLPILFKRGLVNNTFVANTLDDALKNKRKDTKLFNFITEKRALVLYCQNVIDRIKSAGLENRERNTLIRCQEVSAIAQRIERHNKKRLQKLAKKIELLCDSIDLTNSY